MATDNNIKFIGDGSTYEDGIPARNLTPAEWAAIDPDTQTRLIASGLYALPTKKDGK